MLPSMNQDSLELKDNVVAALIRIKLKDNDTAEWEQILKLLQD